MPFADLIPFNERLNVLHRVTHYDKYKGTDLELVNCKTTVCGITKRGCLTDSFLSPHVYDENKIQDRNHWQKSYLVLSFFSEMARRTNAVERKGQLKVYEYTRSKISHVSYGKWSERASKSWKRVSNVVH